MARVVDDLLVTSIRATRSSGEVLDLPAGAGGLSERLAAEGYDVTPADLFPEHLLWEGRKAVRKAACG